MATRLRSRAPGPHSRADLPARPHGALPPVNTSAGPRSPGTAGDSAPSGRRGRPTVAHVIATLSLSELAPEQQDPRPLPLAELPRLLRDGSMLYGIGRVDASGRVTSIEIIRALGWQPGDRLDITLFARAMVIQASPNGVVSVPCKPCIVIPAGARHRYAITAGDDVFLAAAPDYGMVIIHALSALDDMLSWYHATTQPGSGL
jgi:bifunctional DNA-binding transcriptional regulator/antitoxin component of YhaV-PrlF toxin-antitoxin module